MITAAIGYLGYALINLWGPLQIAHMLRSRHIELGRLPLITLVLGMACLQVSFAIDGLPLYTQAGNGMGLTFCTVMLALVSYQKENSNMARIKLGQKVRDTITGMEGVVVARTEWLNGCVRVTVQPQMLKDGIPLETQAFDEPQMEVVKDTPAPKAEPRHGPRPAPVRTPDVLRRD